MKRLLFLLLAVLPLAAAEPTLSEQLRDALYAEEVERDPAKAAESYEKILADFDQQRPLAASALFRLAEVRRKQDKKDEAIALYQRLLREFSEFEAESKLAREHLATLGGEIPEAGDTSPEKKEIARLKQLKENAPDIFLNPGTLDQAIAAGQLPPIRFLLENGADPNTQNALVNASRSGFLEVCKLLFEHDLKPDKRSAPEAIQVAYEQNHQATLNYLLERLVNPDSPHFVDAARTFLPLNLAIRKHDLKSAKLFHQYGAELNRFDAGGDFTQDATPLHIATIQGELEAVEFLLQHGAKPDLPSTDNDVTPLHLAVQSKFPHSMKILKLLLDKGADPNRVTGSQQANTYWDNFDELTSATPLEIALRTNQPEKVEVLLAAGAKITTADLLTLASNKNAELLAQLLEHTPDFSPDDPEASRLLEAAAKAGMNIAPLIAKGAKPSATWIEQGFPSTQVPTLNFLREAFLFPKLSSQNKVWLIRPKWWNGDELLLPLADKSQDPVLPSTAQALLDSDIASQLNFFDNDNDPNKTELETRWTLWRKNDKGELTATEFDLADDTELPALAWGDVLEIRTLGNPIGKTRTSLNHYVAKSNSTYWNLLRRVSFPIKVTRGEEISELTVRGDCLSYDPTKPIVPLLSAGFLSSLLYPDAYHQAISKHLEVIVYREGWDPVRLSYNTKEWKTFPLQANDRISIDAPLGDENSQWSARIGQIRLTVPGTDFSRYHKVEHSPVLLPMLSELITETYASWKFFEPTKISDYSKNPLTRLGEIAHAIKESPDAIPYILPHPDFAGIRIRRLQEDGSETLITPRLAESLAALTDQSTREQLAEGDIRLQPGDIVELPLKESTEPWSGFDKQESRYFHRLLSGAFQLTDDKGSVSRQTINWQPAKLLPSPCGPIPFQPEIGTASTSAFALGVTYSYLQLRRNDENYDGVSPTGFFIRDGDQLSPGYRPPPQPRVRRVPTPTSR